MSLSNPKAGYFVIEGLNAFGATFYLYYLFFFMQTQHGLGNLGNLCLSATHGFVYMLSARWGGRFAQRRGYFKALRLGFSIMLGALVGSGLVAHFSAKVGFLILWTFGICLVWPTLEAMVSEKESSTHLPRMVGLYNLVWAAAGSLACFIGGAILETLGLQSLFWLPITLILVQLGMLPTLENRANLLQPPVRSGPEARLLIPELNPRPIAKARAFLHLAWLANPFAYVAINTVVAVIPGIAKHLELTPTFAGFFCSLWLFARLATFGGLWWWHGWHYRFRYFLAAFVLLIVGFAVILFAPNLPAVIAGEILFGMAVGLIYYSSLFYSMDASDAKGEHGGVHEAAIGLGIFTGPALGASALYVFPHQSHSDAWAVLALLLTGFAALVYLRPRKIGRF